MLNVFAHREGRQALILIASSCLVSFVVLCFIFPELFLFHQYSFIRFSDTVINYQGIFWLVSNFYHGGIQLWDMYDQLPIAYQHLVAGIYNYINLSIAAAFIIFEKLFASPAVAFHAIYSFVFFMAPMVVRAIGAFLLASRFTSNKCVLFVSCVLMNTFLMPHFHLGLNTNALFSLFPLMAYFVMRYFEFFRLKDLVICIVIYSFAFATTPLVSISYFYQGIHFVIVPCAVWAIIQRRRSIWNFLKTFSLKAVIERLRLSRQQLIQLTIAATLCAILALPSVLMLKGNYKDYEFDHENSRFTNIMSVKAYFERSLYFAPKKEFLWRLVDFKQSNWAFSWVYVGFLTVLLVVMGAVISKDSRKYIFIGAVFLFWLINSPRMSHSFTDLAHWINALTNPFKFAPNTFHMAGALQMCFVLFPLVVLGLKSIEDSVGVKGIWGRLRIVLAGVVLAAFAASVLPHVDAEIKKYVLRSLALGILFLAVLATGKLTHRMTAIVASVAILVLLVWDGSGMRRYIHETFKEVKMISHKIQGLEHAGYVNLDYRNPKILPRRLYFLNRAIGQVKYFIQSEATGMQGLYYQATDLYKYFIGVDNYHPRHKSYADWPGKSKRYQYYTMSDWLGDKSMFQYMAGDTRIMFQANTAVRYQPGVFDEIVSKGWERRVVAVHGDVPGELAQASLPQTVANPIEDKVKWAVKKLPLASALDVQEHYGLLEYRFALPVDYPKEMSSTIFSNDRFMTRVNVVKDGKVQELTAAQGKLVGPLTFDARNMYTDQLTVMLPKGYIPPQDSINFLYRQSSDEGMTGVWRNEHDHFGFDYIAPQDGWLVIHYPYDSKWKMEVDEKPVKIYQVNKSFIGVPVTKGQHRILLQYWPASILRPAIILSTVVYLFIFFGILYLGIETYVFKGRSQFDPKATGV